MASNNQHNVHSFIHLFIHSFIDSFHIHSFSYTPSKNEEPDNDGIMSGQRRRCWVNIIPSLFERFVFAGHCSRWSAYLRIIFRNTQWWYIILGVQVRIYAHMFILLRNFACHVIVVLILLSVYVVLRVYVTPCVYCHWLRSHLISLSSYLYNIRASKDGNVSSKQVWLLKA